MTTKLGYTFKKPNHKATVKQIDCVIRLYERKKGKLSDEAKIRDRLSAMTVLQVSNIIEGLLR